MIDRISIDIGDLKGLLHLTNSLRGHDFEDYLSCLQAQLVELAIQLRGRFRT